jgi:3,4-dihydroxy 2-butanone 4-phosphate synthase/GTP cyclohydrolase II
VRNSLHRALADLAEGKPITLAGPGVAEVVVPASRIDTAHVAIMAREAGGLVRVALTPAACERLELEPMARRRAARHGEDWQISVEAREGVTTGISAADRARTIRVLGDPLSTPEDLVQPGHIVPVRAHRPGPLRRLYAPELALELCELAFAGDVAALCHILDEDGELADEVAVEEFAYRTGLATLAVEDVPVASRMQIVGSLFPE